VCPLQAYTQVPWPPRLQSSQTAWPACMQQTVKRTYTNVGLGQSTAVRDRTYAPGQALLGTADATAKAKTIRSHECKRTGITPVACQVQRSAATRPLQTQARIPAQTGQTPKHWLRATP
jgi:hypothetical protein